MEKEITRLKLNATNIKNSLISSNKELKKLRVQKKDLFFKLEKQKEVRAEEKRLETPQIGKSFERLASIVTTPAKSIFDRILEFFGLIVVRALIGELPKLISKVDAFFNSGFMKTVVGILTTIGTGLQKVGELIGLIPKQEQDQIMKDLKEIEKNADNDLTFADQADKDIITLQGLLGQAEKPEKPESQTPQPPPKKEKEEETTRDQPAKPVKPLQAQPQLKLTDPGSMYPEPQKFSRGGTVKAEDEQGKPVYQPKKSIGLKTSQRALTDGFKGFSDAVTNISESAERDEKNMLALSEVSKNFNMWDSMLKFFGGGDGGDGGGDGGDGGGDGGGGALTAGQWGPLLDLIASKESGGNYEAMYPSTTLPGATQMTISQVASRATGAVGKYQQLPQYLVSRAKAAGLNPDKDLYNKENQDLIAGKVNIGQNRGGNQWLQGKITDEQFMQRLSMEFAALPNARGEFYYPRQRSSITPSQVRGALSKVKTGGYSAEELSRSIEQVPPGKTKVVVSSRYGVQRGNRMHGGTDLATNAGAPLRAVADGSIIETGFQEGWGYFLVYKDTSGLYHLYGHMPRGSYKTRGKVKKGEVIGKVGSTGRSSGPHLHWEIGRSWNGTIGGKFDPLSIYTKDAPFNTPLKPTESKQSTSLLLPKTKEQKTQEAVNTIFLNQKRTQYVPVVMPAPARNSLATGASASPALSPLWGV